jgi:hypothetical protein
MARAFLDSSSSMDSLGLNSFQEGGECRRQDDDTRGSGCRFGCCGRPELRHDPDKDEACPAQTIRCSAEGQGCDIHCARRDMTFHVQHCFWKRTDKDTLASLRERSLRAVVSRAVAEQATSSKKDHDNITVDTAAPQPPEIPSTGRSSHGRGFNLLLRPLISCRNNKTGQTTSPTGTQHPFPLPVHAVFIVQYRFHSFTCSRLITSRRKIP